jgi:hypothetical protein
MGKAIVSQAQTSNDRQRSGIHADAHLKVVTKLALTQRNS